MHKGKTEALTLFCLHKIKGLQREKRTDPKLRLQMDLDGDTTEGRKASAPGWLVRMSTMTAVSAIST